MIIQLLARLHIPTIMVGDAVGNIIILNRIKDQTGMENLKRIWISVRVISWREGLAKGSETITICFDGSTKATNQCFTVAKDM